MNLASALRLLALSAIWGGSFPLTRVGVQALGPPLLIASRVTIAALFLFVVALTLKRSLDLRANWRHFLALGFLNSALPFMLFALAAQTLSGSLLAILNATSPIWGAVVGAVWFRTALKPSALLGMLLGITGVALLAGFDPSTVSSGAVGAIAMALCAALSYGLATTYATTARKIDSFTNAHGCMWAATLLLCPVVPFYTHNIRLDLPIAVLVLSMGIVCSGIAYLIYFRLISDIGPTSALTVTFLIPFFGVLFGHVFLNEPIGFATLAGACLVVAGTALTTGFSVSALRGQAGKA